MAKSLNWWTRKLHRWGAVLFAVPMIIVIVSGLLLQVKKQFAWIQPPTQRGASDGIPSQDWQQLLAKAQSVPEAKVAGWSDISRIDVQPSKGIAKLQTSGDWEIQVDLQSGEVLSSAQRRSDWIESLHDGSYFSDAAKLWVFLPNGLVLLVLWLTGIWLWLIPTLAKRKSQRKRAVSVRDA